MATTAGALTQITVASTTAVVQSAVATGGTAPYTYQWYRSTTTGFSPGSGNIIAGATSLILSDSGLTPGTIYYYEVIATDSGSTAGDSAQLTVTTLQASLSQNTFKQSSFLGMVDQAFNANTLAVQIDNSVGATLLYPGQAVKFSTTSGGMPKVVPCTATADVCAGFLNFSIKDATFGANQAANISMNGNVIYLYAATAINRGQFVSSLPAGVAGGCNGGVIPTASSDVIVGWSLDTVAIGSLVRIMSMTPPGPWQIN